MYLPETLSGMKKQLYKVYQSEKRARAMCRSK